MNDSLSAAYAAGILDGEGSISMTRVRQQYWRIVISVSNCDKPLILWLQEHWQGSTLLDMDRGPTKRSQHRWTAVGKAAKGFLEETEPFLIIKKDRARWALEYFSLQRQTGNGGYTLQEKQALEAIRRKFDEDPNRSWSVKERKPQWENSR